MNCYKDFVTYLMTKKREVSFMGRLSVRRSKLLDLKSQNELAMLSAHRPGKVSIKRCQFAVSSYTMIGAKTYLVRYLQRKMGYGEGLVN